MTGTSYKRLVAWCRLPDGWDVSCVGSAPGWRFAGIALTPSTG